jgi:hypothetical protein
MSHASPARTLSRARRTFMIRTATVGTMAVTFALWISGSPAVASPPMLGKAKSAGFPAQSCQYCHVSKLPKKEEFKPDDLSERGRWLLSEKDKRKAKEVMADWLKDYPGGKEQK